jgi:hypothetical protein
LIRKFRRKHFYGKERGEKEKEKGKKFINLIKEKGGFKCTFRY